MPRSIFQALILACLVLMQANVIATEEYDAKQLQSLIDPLVKNHDGSVGVMLKHLPSGTVYKYQADQAMGTASLIKLPVLMALYDKVHRKELELTDNVTLTDDDKVPGSGILTSHFSAGAQLPLRDAAQLMIVYSDNTATNLVVDQIGLNATNQLMKKLGCEETRLNAKVYRRDTSNDIKRSQNYGLGSTTAEEMVQLMELLFSKKFIDAKTSEAVLAHLYECDDRSKVPRHLPSEVKIAHKTGAVNDIRTDAGLIEIDDGALLFCVLTSGNKDRSWGDDNAAELLAAEIGRIGYDFFCKSEDPQAVAVVQTLKMGASGTLVEGLQRTLNARVKPSPSLSVDGDFGPNTDSAVRAFERQSKLPVDGIVDREFWAQLGPLVSEEEALAAAEAAESAEPVAKEPAEQLDEPPLTTAKAWIVVDADSDERLAGKNDEGIRDPASTTKIMTAYLVLSLAQEDSTVLDEVITFSQQADDTTGSSCSLRAGEQLTVGELLYGLMLPSGNDAAYALADYFGGRVAGGERGDGYDDFIAAMNDRAKQLGMNNTGYRNPHGLTDDGHVTTAADLARLAKAAMQIPKFREIVSTRQRVTMVDSQSGYKRKVMWRNTNRLLKREGYLGVKTGTTGPAGACLVSCGIREGRRIFVVVLGSTSTDARYVDSRNIYRWIWSQQPTGSITSEQAQ